jgi:hypothetical protein
MVCICNIRVDLSSAQRDMDALFLEISGWSDAKIEAFQDFWNALALEGAQVGDVVYRDGIMTCVLSDDIRRAVADFRGQP